LLVYSRGSVEQSHDGRTRGQVTIRTNTPTPPRLRGGYPDDRIPKQSFFRPSGQRGQVTEVERSPCVLHLEAAVDLQRLAVNRDPATLAQVADHVPMDRRVVRPAGLGI
jgi:hypothetical protein